MRKRALGIFAHVDAGKTTFCENLLYITGALPRPGRVDHQNTLLDHDALERRRGITIYSGVAAFSHNQHDFYLLDTPGHVDFSAEMERALSVIDAAVLLISATDGVQSHAITVFHMLRARQIPTYLFVNKMDLPNADLPRCLADIKARLTARALYLPREIDWQEESLVEAICETDDALMAGYLEGNLPEDALCAGLRAAIRTQAILPVMAGSALRGQGIEDILTRIDDSLAPKESASEEFAAKAFKTLFDKKGQSVTLIQCLSGALAIKQELPQGKVQDIRAYQGDRYTSVDSAAPGDIVGLTGLSGVLPGMGLGANPDRPAPELLQARQDLPQALFVLQSTEVFHVGTTDVDHKIIDLIVQPAKHGQVVGRRLIVRRHRVFPQVAADHRAFSASAAAQVFLRRFRAFVVESHAVDERPVGGQAEQAGLWIAGLAFRGDRADLHKTETEAAQLAVDLGVLVESGGQPDGVRKFQPEHLPFERGVFYRETGPHQGVKTGDPPADLHQPDQDVVDRLRREQEKQRTEKVFVHLELFILSEL